jgi:uncharacterized protein YecE (DUF72 family)
LSIEKWSFPFKVPRCEWDERGEKEKVGGQVYVGIAGWSYPDWKGIVYTQPGVDQLEFVSRFVDCIEINNTFYRPPSEKTTKAWLQRTSKKAEFFFTAKLHRDFTHEGNIDAEIVKQFHTDFGPLLEADRLRHLLVQFRYDFADCDENRKHLSKIVKSFSDAFNLAVEVRHKSWQEKDALQFLEELGVAVCNLDYPTTYDSFDMQHCTVGINGYFRMHGRNEDKWFSKSSRDETYNYYYNDDELGQIKQRIDKLANAFETLTIIANNHYRGAELANALELKALLSGEKQLVPQGLLKAYPNLAKIALKSDNSQIKFWD